ncbi:MAG: TrmH family RNA methyltransferase [Treponema sp.]|nr:TrmH family RNA methyltransferase [Treponema sp.]
MIEPGKLFQLEGGQKRRKLALTFGALERDILGIAEKGTEYSFTSLPRAEYIRQVAAVLLRDPKLSDEAGARLRTLLESEPLDELRVCNYARNTLLEMLGTCPAEWDLVIAPHAAQTAQDGTVRARDFYPGVCVYAEDIRSPFNIGSIFRSAEAMGAEKVFISPHCIDPTQPRAIRSGMGCIETMGWQRLSLEELPQDLPVFALETGGTDINAFEFPKKGICIIGSEELGVSPEALARATYGTVTIPMKGLKASLNVGVAFGILMQKWTEFLSRS